MPRPRKESPAMERMAPAIPRVTCTIMGAMELGITYLMMMRQSLHPMERAASINSWSFTVSTDARTVLAKVGT